MKAHWAFCQLSRRFRLDQRVRTHCQTWGAVLALAAIASVSACTSECDTEIGPALTIELPEPGSGIDRLALQCSERATCTTREYCVVFSTNSAGLPFPPDDRATAENALHDWEQATGAKAHFQSASLAAECASGQTLVNLHLENQDFFNRNTAGCTRGYALEEGIFLNSDRIPGNRALGFVIRHEVGHILGLGHSINRSEIMYDTYLGADSPAAITTGDLEALQKAWGCCFP